MSYWRQSLGRVHQRNIERRPWYRRWHERPYHQQVHYAVAHLVGWPLVSVIIISLVVTTAGLRVIWSAQSVQAAGNTWTSTADFASWTKTDTVAKSDGTIQLAATAGAPSSVATITGFTQPVDSVAANGTIYVADSSARVVRKVNPATNAIVASINLATSPRKIIIGSDGLLYVVAESSLYVINPATDALSGPYTIDAGGVSWSIAQAPNGNLYITNLSTNQVTVMDPTTHAVLRTIPAGAYERGIAVGSDGIMYVTNANSNSMTVIDTATDTVLATVTGLSNPNGVVIADDGYVYVVNSVGDTVVRINPTTRAIDTTISVGSSPIALLKDANSQLWVTNLLSNNVMRINPTTNTVTGTVSTGTRPWGLGLGADGDVYVGTQTGTTVTRVNPGALSYTTTGTATTNYTPQADQLNTWSSASADLTTPAGTSISLEYSSDDSSWHSDIASVPSSTTLYVRASFAGTTSATPALNSLTVNYAAAESGDTSDSDQGGTANNNSSNTTSVATNSTSDTNTASNTSTSKTEDDEEPAAPVAKPENVQAFAGAIGVTVTFKAPPPGYRVSIWRSADTFSDGMKVESTDQSSFLDTQARPYPTIDTYYYRVETYRVSDMKYSEPVRVSAKYSRDYFYGLLINTRNVTLKAGESQQLAATVIDNLGNQVNLPVTWTLADTSIGTLTADGLFTAGQVNGYWESAIKASVSANGLSGEAYVPVAIDRQGSVVAAVALSPESVTLKPGQTQPFSLYIIDQYGARKEVDQTKVTWSSNVGTMSGAVLTAGSEEKVSSNGVVGTYVDEAGQTWQVQARVPVSSETPYLQRVSMTGTRRLATGSTYRYVTAGYDQFNSYLGSLPTRSYQSSDTSVATIDPAGNVHVGDQVGCYYWILRGSQTYEGRSDYALSGIITRPLTDAQMATADQARYVAWRQVKYVFKPGEKYQFIASVYDGWGQQAPGEYAVFEMADQQAGSITANGLFTASTANGLYNAAINVYFQSTRTGERRLGQTIKMVIANEDQTLGDIETRSVKTLSNWHWVTSARVYNQFGLPFTKPYQYSWSLTGGNSTIRQNGQIDTGSTETSDGVIDIAIKADGTTKRATTRGNLVSSDNFTLGGICAPPTTPNTGGTITGPDGEELIIDNESWSEIVNPPIVDIVEDQAPVDIVKTAKRAQTAVAPLVAVAIIGALPDVLSTIFQVAGEAVTRTSSSLLGLLQIFGFSRRNMSYGLVTSGRRRRPVAGALIELVSPANRGVIETQHTDSAGRFVCLQDKPIPYVLRVTAAGFKTREIRVTGTTIHRQIRLDAAFEADRRAMVRHQLWSKLSMLLVWLGLALLVVGTAFWFIVIRRDGLNLLLTLLGAYYTLAWVLEYLLITMPRPFGDLKDAVTGQPLPFVVVTLLSSGKVVSREVTNQRGHYRALIRPGVYDLTFTRPGYQSVVKKGLVVTKKSGTIGLQVKLRPLS